MPVTAHCMSQSLSHKINPRIRSQAKITPGSCVAPRRPASLCRTCTAVSSVKDADFRRREEEEEDVCVGGVRGCWWLHAGLCVRRRACLFVCMYALAKNIKGLNGALFLYIGRL